MKKIKCFKCQKFIVNEDDRLEINGKDYHKSCYCKSDSEKDDKNKLREYIKSLYCRFNEEIPQDAKINTLILQAQTCMIHDDEFEIEYCQNRKLSFEQLYKIIEYAYEFENKTPKFYSRNPFSVVPYYYFEQLKFEEQCKEIRELVENHEFEDKVIVIKKSRTEKSRYKEINMEDL